MSALKGPVLNSLHENESGFTRIPTRRFQSGDQGSYRQREIKKPDVSKVQGTGERDVDDNSPFAEPIRDTLSEKYPSHGKNEP
jgi:hypothetical protein